jgi:hypothetical protein
MESTGLPERIQISEAFNEQLHKHYPEFKTSPRGKIDIKVGFTVAIVCFYSGSICCCSQGKGECFTHWLEGKMGPDGEIDHIHGFVCLFVLVTKKSRCKKHKISLAF